MVILEWVEDAGVRDLSVDDGDTAGITVLPDLSVDVLFDTEDTISSTTILLLNDVAIAANKRDKCNRASIKSCTLFSTTFGTVFDGSNDSFEVCAVVPLLFGIEGSFVDLPKPGLVGIVGFENRKEEGWDLSPPVRDA